MELSKKEYDEYFRSKTTCSAIPYIIEAMTEITADVFGMKANEKERYWFGEWEDHKRKVITIWAPKGTTRMLLWGWNYDYIPHPLNGNKVKYARTENSFSTDVEDHYMYHLYDYGMETIPRDIYFDNMSKYEFPERTNNIEIAREYTRDICMNNIPFIQEFFESVRTDEECMELLDKRLKIPSPYTARNEAFIKSFILAKKGHLDEAEHLISHRYYEDGYCNEKILIRLKKTAAEKEC